MVSLSGGGDVTFLASIMPLSCTPIRSFPLTSPMRVVRCKYRIYPPCYRQVPHFIPPLFPLLSAVWLIFDEEKLVLSFSQRHDSSILSCEAPLSTIYNLLNEFFLMTAQPRFRILLSDEMSSRFYCFYFLLCAYVGSYHYSMPYKIVLSCYYVKYGINLLAR